MTITSAQLKNISLPYSSTCHSIQGLTINEPYTIFDTNIVYADRRWIYTSITRASDFNSITIFEHSKRECDILEKCKFRQYYELKINNYIQQDITAGRIIKTKQNELIYKGNPIDDYIDQKWFLEHDNFRCYMCGDFFDIEIVDAKVNSNMTVDRVNNSLYHSKVNCRLCCVCCNTSKINL